MIHSSTQHGHVFIMSTAWLSSDDTSKVIERVQNELYDGEKVLLLGKGESSLSAPSSAQKTFAIMVLCLLSMFVLPVILGTIATALQNCCWICWVIVTSVAIYVLFVKGRSDWFAFTTERLLRVYADGKIKTYAVRSDVARIEAGGDRVKLSMTKHEGEAPVEITISQVRGLPEIVGGRERIGFRDREV